MYTEPIIITFEEFDWKFLRCASSPTFFSLLELGIQKSFTCVFYNSKTKEHFIEETSKTPTERLEELHESIKTVSLKLAYSIARYNKETLEKLITPEFIEKEIQKHEYFYKIIINLKNLHDLYVEDSEIAELQRFGL